MHALTIISAIFVISGVLAAMLIALDLRRRPQPMRIMDSVWVLTGLWAGPLGLWAYLLLGRVKPNSLVTQPTVSVTLTVRMIMVTCVNFTLKNPLMS